MKTKPLIFSALMICSIVGGCSDPIIEIGDTVTYTYEYYYQNGMLFETGTSSRIIQDTDPFLKKKPQESITETIEPRTGSYNNANYQLIDPIFFDHDLQIGEEIFIDTDGLGTGIVRTVEKKEGENVYGIDFNARETFQPYQGIFTITEIQKP